MLQAANSQPYALQGTGGGPHGECGSLSHHGFLDSPVYSLLFVAGSLSAGRSLLPLVLLNHFSGNWVKASGRLSNLHMLNKGEGLSFIRPKGPFQSQCSLLLLCFHPPLGCNPLPPCLAYSRGPGLVSCPPRGIKGIRKR